MSNSANLEDELGGLDLNGLPEELQEEARQEKKSQGGYRFNSPADRAHIKAQRGAIWAWIRGLGGNLIKHGVNLTKVPLPVELCEARSFLERLTDSWAYMDLLHAAAAATDPAERLKLVVAFAVGGMRQQVSCDKPFNPILGETLQGRYSCGCEVCAEQISHHPPISCWQIRDHAGRFEYTGSSCWSASFQGNTVKGTQSGESCVRFASDGACVTWTLPCIHIRGVLFGERVVKYQDTIIFRDGLNNLECVLQIEPNAPKRGLVRRVLHKARHPRGKAGGVHDALVGELLRLPPPGKKGETLLDTCSGTWLTDLTWDKGVRSTVLPDSFDPAAAAAAAKSAAAAAAAAAAAEEGESVVCHSIGSFSTTSGSTVSDADAADTAAAAAEGSMEGAAATVGGAATANGVGGHHHKHHSTSSSSSGLTAAALAAHTAAGSSSKVAPAEPQQPQQQQAQQPAPAAAAAMSSACNGSAANLSSSDAAHRRTGKGISVVKQLWAPNISTVFSLQRLRDDDLLLLPSDSRYRPDVLAHGAGVSSAAQRWKQLLEQRQRADRNLRGHVGHSHGGAGHGASSSSGGAAQHHRPGSRGSDHMGGDEQIIRA